MRVSAHTAFTAMYYALEAATDEYDDQGLKTFVQDCDPFVWKDHFSADPAVYAEFYEAYSIAYGDKEISPKEARSFCRGWLEQQATTHEFYAGPLVAAYDSIATPEDWESVLADL